MNPIVKAMPIAEVGSTPRVAVAATTALSSVMDDVFLTVEGAQLEDAVAAVTTEMLRLISVGDTDAALALIHTPLKYYASQRSTHIANVLRKRAAAAASGPLTFVDSSGNKAEVRLPGILDPHVLSYSRNLNGLRTPTGELTARQHEIKAANIRRDCEGRIEIAIEHEEYARIIREAGLGDKGTLNMVAK